VATCFSAVVELVYKVSTTTFELDGSTSEFILMLFLILVECLLSFASIISLLRLSLSFAEGLDSVIIMLSILELKYGTFEVSLDLLKVALTQFY
jgi:hypothetical protein